MYELVHLLGNQTATDSEILRDAEHSGPIPEMQLAFKHR